MRTPFELWLAMVLTQLVCGSALLFLAAVAAYQLRSEWILMKSVPVRTPRMSRVSTGSDGMVKSSPPLHTDQHPSTKQRNRRNNNNRTSDNTFVVFFAAKALAVCLCFVMNSVVDLLSQFGLVSCSIRGILGTGFYQCGRILALTVFIDRIGLVYRDSVYEYSQRTLNILYIVTFFTYAMFFFLWTYFGENQAEEVRGYRNGFVCRASNQYVAIPVLALAVEWSLEVTALRMFTSPLRIICQIGRELDESSLDMAALARKTTVLSYVMFGIMVLATMIMVATRNFIAGRPAAVIYCTCLLLFPHWFDDWYPKLCAGPILLSEQCCALPTTVTASKMVSSMRKRMSSMGDIKVDQLG